MLSPSHERYQRSSFSPATSRMKRTAARYSFSKSLKTSRTRSSDNPLSSRYRRQMGSSTLARVKPASFTNERKRASFRNALFSPRRSAAVDEVQADPIPPQVGKRVRVCVQQSTHGIARSEE